MTIQKALSHNWVQHKNVAEVSFYGVGAKTKMGKKIESEKLLASKIDFDVPCAQERVCKKPCPKHFYNKTIEDSLLELFQRHVFNKQFRHNMIQGCKVHNKEEATLALRYDFPPQSYIKYEGNRIEILSIFAYKPIKVPYLPLMPSSEMPFDFSLPLHIGGVRFEPHLNDIDNKDFFNNAMVWRKCQKGSKELGTFPNWLGNALQRHKDSIIKTKNEHQEAIEKLLQKEGGYTMTISMPMDGFLLKYNDNEYLFETLHVDFIERRHKTMIKYESYKVNQSGKSESCIHYGTAELPNGGKIRVLMPNGMMSEKIFLDIEGLR